MRVSGVPYVQGRNSYSDGDSRKYGVAIHNTSNDAPARGEASYATRRTDGISSHFYVDNAEVIQSLDTDARAGHAGSRNGNENAVAVEITGVNGWTRQQWLDRVAWDKLATALAQVCRHYGIEPRRASVAEMQANPKIRAFYGHDDMRRAWGGTTHTDPGPSFPWDHLLALVKQALNGEDDDVKTTDQLTIAGWGPKTWPDDKGLADGKISAETAWGGAYLHARLGQERTGQLVTMVEALTKLVGGQDASQILTEIRAQHEQTRAAVAGIVPAVLAELPDEGPVSREDLVAALTAVLGSVDGATPQG
ncbi:N-acetylmuramoyl-L-alanine amidase [Micromonospora haikouensis]|uniref:N-acetylmuramoyl-L-alanine amidase n=1 Tax=Micromonospora haikouensis TaxID=686309 RepID=UPI0036B8CCDF